MLSIEPDTQHAVTTATTEAEVVTAPATGHRKQVVAMRIYNGDSGSITPTLKRNINGVRTIIKVGAPIPAGKTDDDSFCSRNRPIHLVPTHSLEITLGNDPTTEAEVDSEFLESVDTP